jgi:hypothetical protein
MRRCSCCEIFYLLNCIATIARLLRRTRVRSVILIVIVDVYNCYQLFFCLKKPTPGRFNSVIRQLHPSGEGMVYNCTSFTGMNIMIDE